jgi:hypothetical protein
MMKNNIDEMDKTFETMSLKLKELKRDAEEMVLAFSKMRAMLETEEVRGCQIVGCTCHTQKV